MEQLTKQEEQVIRIVWKIGEGTIKEYHEAKDAPQVPYTTFASIIGNLEKKNFISIRKIGVTKLCTPIITQEEYKSFFLKSFISNYFKDSYKEVVSFFAKEQEISKDELKEIIELIETSKEK